MSGLQWVVDGYTLMFAALLLMAGSLSDRAGARRAFGAGMAVFVYVAVPVTRRDLAGGMSGLQWVVAGYSLMFAALLL